jgi:hypothetical protein
MVVNSEMNPGAGRREDYPEGGFRIYDIADKSSPKLITFVKTHGKGAHRFDLDANYAYISTEMEGFVGNILVIYDIRNPARPSEVSRWWLPGQNVAAGEPAHPKGSEHRLHHGMRSGDEIYCGFWQSGLAIVDVSHITKPRTLSHYEYDPPCPEPTHTFLKVPFPIRGRQIALSTEEERSRRGPDAGKPHAPFRTWDVTDSRNPVLLCTHHLSEEATPYRGDGIRFGTHQLREVVDQDCLAYVTWFAGGLRVLDVSDPTRPIERGYFIPQPADRYPAPLTNDVAKDDRGLLFLTDKARGLDVVDIAV